MGDTRICHICGTETGAKASCPTCVAAFSDRPPVLLMTIDERRTELAQWLGVLEIPFDLVHERIEELVGRPVQAYEMASPRSLVREIR